MDIDALSKKLGWLPRPILAWLEVRLKRIPAIRERIQREISHPGERAGRRPETLSGGLSLIPTPARERG